MRASSILSSSVLLLLAGCGDDDRPDAAGDAARDAVSDVALDVGAQDATADALADSDVPDVEGDAAVDASPDAAVDASPDAAVDASPDAAPDAGPDAVADASPDADAGARRRISLDRCPGTITAPGLYQGTLASNLNEIPSVACVGATPGREGSVRVELEPGQTVRAVYRHAADGILYILDRCPVVASCLAGVDATSSGAETIEWRNDGAEPNVVYVFLDSNERDGPQTFELDLFVTGS